MKKVLYITYFFPPLDGIAPQRRLKYAKYLPNFGIEPIILTIKPIHYFAYDYGLLKDFPSFIKIYRTGSFDPNRLLYLLKRIKSLFYKSSSKVVNSAQPTIFSESLKKFIRSFFPIDEKIGWLPFCLIKGLKITQKYKVKAIVVSLPPFHSAITGWLISKITSLPLILEYEDLWNLAPYPLYKNIIFKILSEWLERKVLKDVAYVAVTTPTAKTKMLEKYPFLQKDKIDVHYYGWAREDFIHLEESKFISKKPIKIGYAGTFTGYQTPEYFLDAFAELVNKKKITINDFEFHFLGNYSKEIRELFKKPPVRQIIHLHPYMPHQECLAFMKQMNYLAIFLGGGNRSNVVIPGKLFDYLALKVPIIGFSHKGGDLWNILEKYGFPIAEFDDINENMKLILNLMKQKTVQCLTDEELIIYEKKYICSLLAKNIKRIIEQEK